MIGDDFATLSYIPEQLLKLAIVLLLFFFSKHLAGHRYLGYNSVQVFEIHRKWALQTVLLLFFKNANGLTLLRPPLQYVESCDKLLFINFSYKPETVSPLSLKTSGPDT